PRPGRRTRYASPPGPLPPWSRYPVGQAGTGRAGPYRTVHRHRPLSYDGNDLLAASDRGSTGTRGETMMDYEAVLAHVLALLQQEQRIAYRVLKRRLQLDDEI